MQTRTFAIGYAQAPTKVELWCEDHGRHPDGTRRFFVINGGWGGHLTPDGRLYACDGSSPVEGQVRLLWEGSVPPRLARDHNDAIAWIEDQLARDQEAAPDQT